MANEALVIEITNITTRLLGFIPNNVLKEIDHKLSFVIQGHFFTEAYKNRYWDGRRHLFTRSSFPTGLLYYVITILNEHQIAYSIADKRIVPLLGKEISLHSLKLRDYQQDAVDKAVAQQRGLLKMSTGSGKTLTAAAIIGRLNVRTIFYTHRETLAFQTKQRLEEFLQVPIGILGSGEDKKERITVAMVQTISNEKHLEFIQQAQCMIVDECHHLPSDTLDSIQKASVNSFYRYGLSATPYRDAGDDLLVEASTAPPIVDISASFLIKKGYLSKPTIYFVKIPRIPELAHRAYPSVYEQGIVNNRERNLMIVFLCEYLATAGKRVLVTVTKIKHGENILALLNERYPKVKAAFVQGKDEAELKSEMLILLNQKKVSVVIATSIYTEGVDIPELDIIINAKCQKSSVETYQIVGRALRKTEGKNTVTIIDFNDLTKYLHSHSLARIRVLQSEPEYNVKVIDKIEDIDV
jgi:superfamily II DNA or RNA helicase